MSYLCRFKRQKILNGREKALQIAEYFAEFKIPLEDARGQCFSLASRKDCMTISCSECVFDKGMSACYNVIGFHANSSENRGEDTSHLTRAVRIYNHMIGSSIKFDF